MEINEEDFCCFVGFKNVFYTVPRDKIWYEMKEIGILIHLRAVVHRLYEEVKVKIITSVSIYKKFKIKILVKKGCLFSPSLFGLYISKLEEWLKLQGGNGVHLIKFVLRIRLFTDNIIRFSKPSLGLRDYLFSLKYIFRMMEMHGNISKTKQMIFSNRRKHKIHKF